TPQSVNALSGHRVQGRQAAAADQPVAEALAVQEAGASAIVPELVPAEVSARITAALTLPTIGTGAGPSCAGPLLLWPDTAALPLPAVGIAAGPSGDGQVWVWQDMAGLSGFAGQFVKAYAQLGAELERAASAYHGEVAERAYPGPEHSFE